LIALTNLNNKLKVAATVDDDNQPQPPTISWTTTSGPTNAIFSESNSLSTTVSFPLPGTYVLRVTADDTIGSDSAEFTVLAGPNIADQPDATRVLWLS